MALHLRLPLLESSMKKKHLRTSFSQPYFPGLQRMGYFHYTHCLSTANATTSGPARRTANYQPTIWDDSYIQSLSTGFMEDEHLNRRNKLKEDVRLLIGQEKGLIEQLELVDALRQLGVSYHFELEIKDVLSSISLSMKSTSNMLENNLHGSALLFRLLREYDLDPSQLSINYLVKSFKIEKANSNLNLEHDVKGMISLYEASYHAMEGEDELDEVREFTTKYLRNIRGSLLNPQLVEEVDHALELPLHWRISRLHTRWFIDAYEKQANMDQRLLELAKLDFNMVQSIYKKELKEISRWWRNIGLVCDELSFARDRLVEHYLWAVAFTFEPKFWRCRKEISKIFCFITLIDDIYDVYGTFEELELFTKAINEWEMSAVQLLPDYMKICLVSLFNTVNDIANIASTVHGLDILPYLKRSWADLCNAYIIEAMWYHTGYSPTLNEYLDNAVHSIGGNLSLTHAFCLMDEMTVESLNSLEFYPVIIRHSCMLVRLYDDLGTSTDEIQRGDVPKSIQCYMNDKNVSESTARDYIKSLIIKYWKALNKDYVVNSNFLTHDIKKIILYAPRVTQCIYQHRDGHGDPNNETRERVISLLVEPIPL